MKVQTKDNLIVAIGKNLENYNAIDTGIFLCPEIMFEYLRRALKDDDCSLADGVRLMAEDGKALAIDIGEAWWQDVDTPEMLARAEQEATRAVRSRSPCERDSRSASTPALALAHERSGYDAGARALNASTRLIAVHAQEQMQNPGGLSDRCQENKEKHGDITLGQLDQPGRELLPEKQHPGTFHQLAMARIERAA